MGLDEESDSEVSHVEVKETWTTVRETGKAEKKSERDEEEAKRLQLLEGIDLNYYKMIKSTLEMEKENTRRNYEFLRTFKRAKYSTQDQLLEHKRFEASFSGLFTQQCASRTHVNPRSETKRKKTTKRTKTKTKV